MSKNDASQDFAQFVTRLKRIAASKTEEEYPRNSGEMIPWYPRGRIDGPGEIDALEEMRFLISDLHDYLHAGEARYPLEFFLILREIVRRNFAAELSDMVRPIEVPPDLVVESMWGTDDAIKAIDMLLDKIAAFSAELREGSAGVDSGALASQIRLKPWEAASIARISVLTLYNIVSAAKRKGKELDWVHRKGTARGFIVHTQKFLKWLESRPKRRGRPPGSS